MRFKDLYLKGFLPVILALIFSSVTVAQYDTLYIHSKVGRSIDRKEKKEFGLLPWIPRRGFKSAAFVRTGSDTTYTIYLSVKFAGRRDTIHHITRRKYEKTVEDLDNGVVYTTERKFSRDISAARRKEFFPHSVHASFGVFAFVSCGNFYYEYLFKKRLEKSRVRFLSRVGCTVSHETSFFSEPTDNISTSMQVGMLTGNGKRHLELALGFNTGYTYSGVNNNFFIYPAVSVGGRRQKPGSHFIFRYGIGFPDAIYLGMGVSF